MNHPTMGALYGQLDDMLRAAGRPPTNSRERLIYALGVRMVMELSLAVHDNVITVADANKLADDLERETVDIISRIIPPSHGGQ